jgi:hypothetical protein
VRYYLCVSMSCDYLVADGTLTLFSLTSQHEIRVNYLMNQT